MSTSVLSPADFVKEVDVKLRKEYYINIGDISFTEEAAEKCLEFEETPDAVVEYYANKYDLVKM